MVNKGYIDPRIGGALKSILADIPNFRTNTVILRLTADACRVDEKLVQLHQRRGEILELFQSKGAVTESLKTDDLDLFVAKTVTVSSKGSEALVTFFVEEQRMMSGNEKRAVQAALGIRTDLHLGPCSSVDIGALGFSHGTVGPWPLPNASITSIVLIPKNLSSLNRVAFYDFAIQANESLVVAGLDNAVALLMEYAKLAGRPEPLVTLTRSSESLLFNLLTEEETND